MRIVTRKEFLTLPVGTVFMGYAPYFFGNLSFKGESSYQDGSSDFWGSSVHGIMASSFDEEARLLDAAMLHGGSVAMDFEVECRDGMFDDTHMYAVLEPQDVQDLIAKLRKAPT